MPDVIRLVATTKEFRLADASGYEFHVVAERDPEWGWSARVLISSNGFKTDEAALVALRAGVDRLLRMLPSEPRPDGDRKSDE